MKHRAAYPHYMKRLFAILAFAAISLSAVTNLRGADDGGWMTDYKKAFEQAKAENKYVMIDFSGESWCTPCKLLQREVFSTQKFQDYAKTKFILVKVDFPDPVEPPKAARELIEKYLPDILLPTVVITAPDGKKLGQTGYYPGGPDVFIANAQKVIKR